MARPITKRRTLAALAVAGSLMVACGKGGSTGPPTTSASVGSVRPPVATSGAGSDPAADLKAIDDQLGTAGSELSSADNGIDSTEADPSK